MMIFRTVGIAVTVLFLVSTLTPLWNGLGESLSVPSAEGPADMIVVLGAGVSGPILNDESLRRVVHGIELYKRGLAPTLVLSGPADRDTPNLPEGEIRKEMAIRMGVPSDRVVTLVDVATTRDEALKIAAKFPGNSNTVLLVTGSTHMRRAMGVFERVGLQVLPSPSDEWFRYVDGAEGRIDLLRQVLEQTGGLIYYRLFGYI